MYLQRCYLCIVTNKIINVLKQKTMEAQEFLNRIDEFKNVGNLISNYREAKKNCDVMQMVNYFEEIVAKIEIFSNLTHKEAFEVLQKKESQCLAILENAIAKTNKITKN